MFELTLIDTALLIVIAFSICILTTSLAVESGALFLPAFLIGFPVVLPSFPTVSVNEAIGLILVIMFFGQTSALAGYRYRGQIQGHVAKAILLVTIPLAVAGRIASYFLPESVLLLTFTILLFGLTVIVYRSSRRTAAHVSISDRSARVADGSGVTETRSITFTVRDRLVLGIGGAVGGLTGFATGEVTNTQLHVNKGMPIKISTGTSTLVLYLTLIAANLVNIAILHMGMLGASGAVSPPWGIAGVIAPVVLVGGHVGAYLNNWLAKSTTTKLLLATYLLVSIVTISRLV